jgi:tetratricopeptide (TPR) repeat protein
MKLYGHLITAICIIITIASNAFSEDDETCEKALNLLKEDPKADYDHAELLFSKCGCFDDPSDFSKAIECYQKVNKCCDLILAEDDCNLEALKLQKDALDGEERIDDMIRPPPGGKECFCEIDSSHESIIAKYDTAISKNSSNIVAWNDRGTLLGELCCADKAMESFDRAISINPSAAEPWYNKGILLYWDQPEEALNCINKSVERNPQIAEAWINRYALLMPAQMDMNDPSSKSAFEEAMYSYDKALSLSPALGEYQPPYLEFIRMA